MANPSPPKNVFIALPFRQRRCVGCVVVKTVPGPVPVPMFTRPALVTLGTTCPKPLRPSVPPLATVTAEFGLNVFGAPASKLPALTLVAPL